MTTKLTFYFLGLAEMVTYLPISSPFIRFAGRYVDEALGVAAGYNFFIFEAALVPFEIVAVSLIIKYWTDAIPVAAMNVVIIVLYGFVAFCDLRTRYRLINGKQSTESLCRKMVWRSRVLALTG